MKTKKTAVPTPTLILNLDPHRPECDNCGDHEDQKDSGANSDAHALARPRMDRITMPVNAALPNNAFIVDL
jgi:hypothetical protein